MTSSSYVNKAAGDGQQEPVISHVPTVDLVACLFNGGNWFPFFRPFYKILRKTEALFFQDLLNLSQRAVRDGDYFLCTVQYLEEGGWSVAEQKNYLNSLVEKGYILYERRGSPPVRWVIINYPAVLAALVKAGVFTQSGGIAPDRSSGIAPVNNIHSNNIKHSGVLTPPAAAEEGQGEEEVPQRPAGLFPELDRRHRKKGAATEFDRRCARKLRAALVGAGVAGPWSESGWAEHFRLLREADCGGDTLTVAEVLDWYTAPGTVGSAYVPEAFSAKSFRTKFAALKSQAAKSQKAAAVEREREGVSKETLEIVQKYLKKYHWPKGSEKDLPLAVERSLLAHKKLREAYAAFDSPADARLRGFHAHVRHKLFGRSQDFVVRWFEGVFEAVSGWAEWSGNILSCAFQPEREQFQREGRAAAQAYAGKPQLWDDYWTELKEFL